MAHKGHDMEWTRVDAARLKKTEERLEFLEVLETQQGKIASQLDWTIGWILSELGGQDPATGRLTEGNLKRVMRSNKDEVLSELQAIKKVLNGNGKKGLIVRVDDLEKAEKERKEEAEQRRKEARNLWYTIFGGIIIFIINAILTAVWMFSRAN